MHTFQTLVETYHQFYGHYPESIEVLYRTASQDERLYWKNFSNPYTDHHGYRHAILNYDDYFQNGKPPSKPYSEILGVRIYWPDRIIPQGQVLYQYLSPQQYRIYGTGKTAGIFVKDRGQNFVLKP